ncbi:DUF4339 domain-containing protein [Opitutales bacterium]|nr:DUF4339 domain-containing protein [Opitutales bacterium]
MQIYLHQNNQQTGPFTLPRISARLVSGDLDSATLAWHEGLDNWYPLNHEKWQALGLVAPPPREKVPVQQSAPVEETKEEEPIFDSVSKEETDEGDSTDQSTEEFSGSEPVVEEEPGSTSFASYSEEDFKPPSFEEMEKQMIELRIKRAGFPEAIGRRAQEINFRDEEIEDAWGAVESALESGKGEEKAFASLGQAILSAGLNDPGLDELRDDERDVADRMLNLQMQLRRMGGTKQVKGPPSWKKWVILGVTALFFGGTIVGILLAG